MRPHRKAANRLLTGPAPGAVRPPRHRDLRYTAAAIGDAGLVMPALLRLSDAQFDQVDRFVTVLRAAGLTPSRTTHQGARTFSGRLQRAGGLLHTPRQAGGGQQPRPWRRESRITYRTSPSHFAET